jgi:S-adenosylmethionine:tRNA ribosyltransferase-isomerase
VNVPAPLPTAAFDYVLPPHLIAQYPAARRDESRLLLLRRGSGTIEHRVFHEITELLERGDALVLNETRVFPARLLGRKATGAAAEILLIRPWTEGAVDASPDGTLWEAMVRPGSKLKPGRVVEIGERLRVEIVAGLPTGNRVVRLVTDLPVQAALERYGALPLPPYVERAAEPSDADRYQTVYARETGSVAAPTAGLHLTPAVLAALESKGVHIVRLVLHVGIGTFRPVEVADPASHAMHSEWYSLAPDAAATLNEVRAAGRRVWAVGTTVVRTLETCTDERGVTRAGSGWTDIFIRPPYRFRGVDALVTNFHLPRSTLLMLVAAFGGYEAVLRAYGEAIEAGYRFYSFGDAMAVL